MLKRNHILLDNTKHAHIFNESIPFEATDSDRNEIYRAVGERWRGLGLFSKPLH